MEKITRFEKTKSKPISNKRQQRAKKPNQQPSASSVKISIRNCKDETCRYEGRLRNFFLGSLTARLSLYQVQGRYRAAKQLLKIF